MLAKIKHWFDFHKQQCDALELEQALIRVGMGLLILSFLIYRNFTQPFQIPTELIGLKAVIVFNVPALLLVILIFHSKKQSALRRLSGAWLDIAATTFFMSYTGELGVILVGILLWVIFGNGFRFGRKYLFHAQILSLSGFLYTTQTNPFWQTHQTISYSLFFMLIGLPIYIAGLIQRLDEARQKAEDASTAKTHFVANMSHEIRTPLNGIIGISTLFKTTPLNHEQQDLLKTLEGSSRLLLSLLNNVLDFAKIEDGKIAVETTSFTAEEIVHDTIELFQAQATSKGINLTGNTFAFPNLIGDPYLLKQILANLVGNAVKFTERGSITLTTSILNTGLETSTIRFEVADTGVGIPANRQSKIFESFTQADASTTRRFGGSGLGLTIAKHLVNAIGGDLLFQSTEGLGSRFWFDLTLKNDSQHHVVADALQNQVETKPSHTLNILVCEDDATNQKILVRLLQLPGHQVVLTTNGDQLLDQLEKSQFDVVIADLNMAGISGIDALKLYRFMRPDDQLTRFILFTADATLNTRNAATEAGFDAFLGKPMDALTLFGTIANLLNFPSNTAEQWMSVAMSDARHHATPPISIQEDILNASILQKLEMLGAGDTLFVHRLLRNYLRDAIELIDSIDNSLKEKKYGALHEICHALKGNSLSIGAHQITKCTETIDQATPAELRFRGAAMVEQLRKEYTSLQSAIEDYLSHRVSATR
jgi:two-component system sensor histidine kinase RpfC